MCFNFYHVLEYRNNMVPWVEHRDVCGIVTPLVRSKDIRNITELYSRMMLNPQTSDMISNTNLMLACPFIGFFEPNSVFSDHFTYRLWPIIQIMMVFLGQIRTAVTVKACPWCLWEDLRIDTFVFYMCSDQRQMTVRLAINPPPSVFWLNPERRPLPADGNISTGYRCNLL